MKLLKNAAMVVVLATFAATAFASVIQSTNPAGSSEHGGSTELGRVTFAAGTNYVSNLSSTVTLVDQGWGGSDPSNGVYVGLFNGNTDLYNLHLAGANHQWTTQTQDFNSTDLIDLNTILASIDQDSNPLLTMRMFTNSWGYQGWSLTTSNASMSVTSAHVPEPTSISLLGLGLLGFAIARRKVAAK